MQIIISRGARWSSHCLPRRTSEASLSKVPTGTKRYSKKSRIAGRRERFRRLPWDTRKVLSFQKQLIAGGKNLLGYGANAPSQVGGLEWSMPGYEHYKRMLKKKKTSKSLVSNCISY